MTFTVDLCTNFVKVGEAEAFEFVGSHNHLAAGLWTLTGTPSGLSAPDLSLVDSVIVFEDNAIRYAGITRSVPDVAGSYQRTVTASGTQVTWAGTDLFGLLGIRQCWPTPSTGVPWADSHDTRTGTASTVAAGYIEANIGVNAHPDRVVANLSAIDPAIGMSGTWTKRLESLTTVVADVCREGLISCIATMPTVGQIVYTFRSARDLSSQYVFSDQGDLESVDRVIVPATSTHVIAAGQGELTSRDFTASSTGATGINRVEMLYENTNILDVDTLQLAADAQLALQEQLVTVDAVLADSALQNIRYGVDYFIGDLLGVEVDGVRHASPVTAVMFEITAQRQRIRPLLGNGAASELSSLLTDVTSLGLRLDRSIS